MENRVKQSARRVLFYSIVLVVICASAYLYQRLSLELKKAEAVRKISKNLDQLRLAHSEFFEKHKRVAKSHEEFIEAGSSDESRRRFTDKRYLSYPIPDRSFSGDVVVIAKPTADFLDLVWIDSSGRISILKKPGRLAGPMPETVVGLSTPLELMGATQFSDGGSVALSLKGKNKKTVDIWLPRPSHPKRVLMFDHVETANARELTVEQEKALRLTLQHMIQKAFAAEDWRAFVCEHDEISYFLKHFENKFD